MPRLTTTRHDRDSAGMTYVYPVLSRRSGGLSIGINLNPNNACNWHCLYCQVPGLTRGAAPVIDLDLLKAELRELIVDAMAGDFFERYALPPEQRVIRDLAISGNGEPTTSPQFEAVIGVIDAVCDEYALSEPVRRVLISNGSQMRKREVQRGLSRWGKQGGEVWFKIDSTTEEGIRRINGVSPSLASVRSNLAACARHCPTWIQTCLFALDGQPPCQTEQTIYLQFLAEALRQAIPIEGVLLYGIARPSLQAEAPRLSVLSVDWLQGFAKKIEALGVTVRVHA